MFDVNDNAPAFTQGTYSATVNFDTLEGAPILQLFVSDADSNTLLGGNNKGFNMSIISGNDNATFGLDTFGRIVLANQPARQISKVLF